MIRCRVSAFLPFLLASRARMPRPPTASGTPLSSALDSAFLPAAGELNARDGEPGTTFAGFWTRRARRMTPAVPARGRYRCRRAHTRRCWRPAPGSRPARLREANRYVLQPDWPEPDWRNLEQLSARSPRDPRARRGISAPLRALPARQKKTAASTEHADGLAQPGDQRRPVDPGACALTQVTSAPP
jgi:hypothetical protein